MCKPLESSWEGAGDALRWRDGNFEKGMAGAASHAAKANACSPVADGGVILGFKADTTRRLVATS